MTIWTSVLEVLLLSLAEPAKTALMAWFPGARDEVLNWATPAVESVALPSVVAPSMKVTVPVGVVVDCGEATVAVKVTFCPKVEGFSDEVSVVVVGAPLTTSTTVFEVLEPDSVLPP